MKKRLRLLTSLTALFFLLGGSSALWALGLGEIKAESALNEPLVAKIELLNVDGLSSRDLIVDIGSAEDYRIAGVERDFFHTDMELEPHVDGRQAYISITSSKPVLEPFVNFVVQVRWPQGKLLREYTILLDLPVFTGRKQQQSIQAPQATHSPAKPSRQPSATTTPKPVKKTPQADVDVGGEYLVQPGDTLWSLSGRIAQTTGSTRKQAMLAIRDNNPNAFMNGDPNSMRAGALLRMPDQGQISNRSATDAAVEFANIQSRASRALEATPVRSSSNNFRDRTSRDASQEGRLALSSNSALGSGGSSENTDGSTNRADLSALSSQNQTLKEELDRAEVENQDLRERVAALEEQLEVAAMLVVENNELAVVQDGLAAQQQIQVTETAVLEAVDDLEPSDPVVDESPEPTQVAMEPEPAAQPIAAVEPQAVEAESEASTSILGTLMGFLPYIGAALVVILLAVMLILKKRQTSEEDQDILVNDLEADMYADEDELDGLPDEAEVSGVQEETDQLAESDDDDFGEGLESMDELFASDDSDEAEPADDSGEAEEAAAEPNLDDVDDDDVEDIDLESALEDLDEFADLDSFFDSDEIEDVDPDSADAFEDSDDDFGADATEEDFTDTMMSEAPGSEEAGEFDIEESASEPESEAEVEETEVAESMDFESIELPGEDEFDVPQDDLHDEAHSMDFDEVELPDADELDLPEESQSDDANSMEFDLDDFDPMGEADGESELEEEVPAGNEMEFDSEDLELPENIEEEPAASLHDDEAHSMDFEGGIELPEVEETSDSLEDSENTMAFDIDDLDLPEAETDSEEGADLVDLDLGEDDAGEDEPEELTDIGSDLEEDMDDLLADFAEDEAGDDDVSMDLDLPEETNDLGRLELPEDDDTDLDLSAGLDLDDEGSADENQGADEALDLDDGLGLNEDLDGSLDLDEDLDLGSDLDLDGDLGLDEDVDLDEGLDLGDDLLADLGENASEDLSEEMNTKLELAEAYVEMVDIAGARELINEILADGSDDQKEAAQKLAERIEGLG